MLALPEKGPFYLQDVALSIPLGGHSMAESLRGRLRGEAICYPIGVTTLRSTRGLPRVQTPPLGNDPLDPTPRVGTASKCHPGIPRLLYSTTDTERQRWPLIYTSTTHKIAREGPVIF